MSNTSDRMARQTRINLIKSQSLEHCEIQSANNHIKVMDLVFILRVAQVEPERGEQRGGLDLAGECLGLSQVPMTGLGHNLQKSSIVDRM